MSNEKRFTDGSPTNQGPLRSFTSVFFRRLAMFVEPAHNVQNLRHMMTRPHLNAVGLIRHAHQHTLYTEDLQCLVILL